jgi:hypothetical protein
VKLQALDAVAAGAEVVWIKAERFAQWRAMIPKLVTRNLKHFTLNKIPNHSCFGGPYRVFKISPSSLFKAGRLGSTLSLKENRF